MHYMLETATEPAKVPVPVVNAADPFQLLIRRVFLVGTEICGELISCRIDPGRSTHGLDRCRSYIFQAPTVNCRVIEKPVGQLQAALVPGHQ